MMRTDSNTNRSGIKSFTNIKLVVAFGLLVCLTSASNHQSTTALAAKQLESKQWAIPQDVAVGNQMMWQVQEQIAHPDALAQKQVQKKVQGMHMPELSSLAIPGLDIHKFKKVMQSYTFENQFISNTLIGIGLGFVSLLVQNDLIEYAPLASAFPYFQAIFYENGWLTFIGIGMQFVEKLYQQFFVDVVARTQVNSLLISAVTGIVTQIMYLLTRDNWFIISLNLVEEIDAIIKLIHAMQAQ